MGIRDQKMNPESKQRQLDTLLDHPGLLPAQMTVLKRFNLEMDKNEGLTIMTRLNEVHKLCALARAVSKPFESMVREDVEGFIYSLNAAPATTDHYKIVIRKFFKWLYRADTYPDAVKWIKLRNKKKRKLPDDILTLQEVRRLIDAADNLRDRAIISVMYDGALRLDELVTLKQKDVTFDQYGARIMINGKTGMRPVRLMDSSPDLLLWMNNHPNKGWDNAVFCHERNHARSLDNMGTYYVVKEAGEKAGIKKNVHPHILRHSRLTELAKELTDSELKVFSGWTEDSRMTGVYVHLSGGDVEKKLLKNKGLISVAEAKKEEVLSPRSCPRCKENNPSTAKFCYRCGMALDMETAMKVEKESSGIALEVMDLMRQNPRLLEILRKFEESAHPNDKN